MKAITTRGCLLTAILFAAIPARAATYNYTGPDGGNWNTAANWTLSGGNTHVIPASGDNATLGLAITVSTVNFNANYLANAGLNTLTLDSPGHTSITLNQTVNSAMVALTEIIGSTVTGNTYNQSAGTNTISTSGGSGSLILGNNAGSGGAYNVSGTASLSVFSSGNGGVVIGNGGVGTFTQSGGAVSQDGGIFKVGGGSAGNNTYTMTGGSLVMTNGYLTIGYGGTGTMTQSAGTVALSGVNNTLYLGGNTGASGTYLLSGTGQVSGSQAVIGANGTGVFSQSGGTATFSSISLGQFAGGNGTYNLSAGTLGTASMFLGAGTGAGAFTGVFNQSGGVHTESGQLYIGVNPGTSGTYNLSGGTLSAAIEAVGSFNTVADTALFAQTGGSNTVSGSTAVPGLVIGDQAGSKGVYTMDNSAGTSTLSANTETIGNAGTGTFTQSAGTNTVAIRFVLTAVSGASGTYNLNGGALSVTSGAQNYSEGIGASGVGVFNQTAGSNTMTGDLELGVNANGTGTYNLGGTGTLAITGQIQVGKLGFGVFNQSGGTSTISSNLYLATSLSTQGNYNLSAGSLTVNGTEYVGSLAAGTFNQTGGTHTINGATGLVVGSVSGATGAYTLSGPAGTTLTNSHYEFIGAGGTGTFTQTSGTHTLNGDMQIGQLTTGTGTYLLNGGVLNATFNIGVGQAGIGTFTQSNGTATVGLGLYVGSGPGSTGTYNISGGTLAADFLHVGDNGNGTFNQTGGAVTGPSGLIIGVNVASAGTYGLTSGATLSSGPEFVGYQGAGTFNQSGGSNTTSAYLVLANYSGASGTYNLGGGTLAVQGGDLTVGNLGGIGTFNQSGGLNVVSSPGALNIGKGSAYILSGGGQLTVLGAKGINVALGSTFHQSGSTSLFALSMNNSGDFIYDSGVFNGTLSNNGTSTINGAFTAGSGIVNNGTVNVLAGGSFGANVNGLDNEGTITLVNSALGGGGAIVNNSTLTGFGTIGGSGGFTNNALVVDTGGNLSLTNSGANRNFGTIDMETGRQFHLTGASLTNSGTFALDGATISGNGAFTNSAAGSLSGPGLISVSLTNAGVLQPGIGTLNVVPGFTNTGLIVLNSYSSNLAGGTITNNGTLQGFGSVGAAVNNVTGTIEALGSGTLALNATVQNPAGGLITASTGNKVLVSAGLATNAGVISLTGGAFDNNGYALNNTGQISGFGTVRTGGLTNAGSITFTGGQTTVNGPVTNNSGQLLKIAYNPATFTGNVVNNGVIKTTSTNVTFAANFTNNGAFISDPSTQNFVNLTDSAQGYLQGSAGDVFNVLGNVTNNSTQTVLFNIAGAQLTLQTGLGTHQFAWAGADLGPIQAGYVNNFAIGIFELQSGGVLNLADGNAIPGVGIYVSNLKLDGGLGQISSITGNGANIYYDPNVVANGYLNDQTYALQNGGFIQPIGVPEPSAWALMLVGSASVVIAARRKTRLSSSR